MTIADEAQCSGIGQALGRQVCNAQAAISITVDQFNREDAKNGRRAHLLDTAPSWLTTGSPWLLKFTQISIATKRDMQSLHAPIDSPLLAW